MHRDLADQRGAGAVGAVPLEHRALDLPTGDALLDEHLRVVGAGRLDRGLEIDPCSTFVMPIDDPARAGLTKSG